MNKLIAILALTFAACTAAAPAVEATHNVTACGAAPTVPTLTPRYDILDDGELYAISSTEQFQAIEDYNTASSEWMACATGKRLPSCAAIGCPAAPSGTGDMSKPWEPCTGGKCYCRTSDTALTACAP